ncbi:MAG: helicase-related protein [Candidatus Omnitrophota bacterium]
MNSLPIDSYQQQIEETIATHPVTILTAETGAGKSTRVPLWMWKKGKVVHVTQPRRIAARSLSLYLAHVTGKTLGQEVGYQTGFESQQSKQTTLLYLTDGVQMIREIKRRRDYDVLILDEIHEWNLNQEVLVGLVKQNLDRGYFKRTGKRVVIMSATLQADRLSMFLGRAPIISVPGRGFPVAIHHNDPRFLLPDTAQMVELEKNVLVFQPGKQEIETFTDDLRRMLEAEKHKAVILPLHSELSLKDQALVFEHYALPKVIVATDIAQTSLTIDDIDAVVDCGIKKEMRLVRGIEGLYPVDISGSECMQRAGRAGRVKSGDYFLCADAGINDRMAFPEPEIQRLNLESIILRLIRMGISPLDFVFFHAPAKALLFKAIKQLKLLGAISEDGITVTEDGKQMAELPVSLRSARMLLEAQKGHAQVVDSALKCIAILETRGIVTKEYAGEKLSNSPYNSDLLNQLALWQMARMYRRTVSGKKFAMANEIYRELKKRIQLQPAKSQQPLKDMDMLFRAILSSFADEVHFKGGEEYQRDNEVRQLERTSVLFPLKPEMLVGLPFDLIVNRENRHTGDAEQVLFPLITFASELKLEYLEALRPFSYTKVETITIKNAKISVFREYIFGGKRIQAFTTPPNFQDPAEKARVVKEVLTWVAENKESLEIFKKFQAFEATFNEIKPLIPHPLMPYAVYCQGFLVRELTENLNIDELHLFFSLNKGFQNIHLKKLLPKRWLNELKATGWPGAHRLESVNEWVDIDYLQGRPHIRVDYPLFEKLKEEDFLLPTGDWAGVILGETRTDTWELAVLEFNRWKKSDLFEKKYKELRKPGNMDDLLDLSFPQPFEGGKGKDNTPFEFYLAPAIDGDQVVLIHFFERREADAYMDAFLSQWEAFVRQYKKKKIEDIFKQKGWKVK